MIDQILAKYLYCLANDYFQLKFHYKVALRIDV